MIYKISLLELTQAAQLIRSQPELTREQFYATMTQANPQGLSQEQIEETIQQVTGVLVTLGYVENNHYDYIAPWIRALPGPQVQYHLEAIYKEYEKIMAPLLLDERIQTAEALLTDLDAKVVRIDSEIVEAGDDEEWSLLLTELRGMQVARKDYILREKARLEEERAKY